MLFDYSKLKGKITEKYGTIENFSKELKITPTTTGRKLSGKSYWSQDEIITACCLLGVPVEEMSDYFFVQSVEFSQRTKEIERKRK